LPAYCSAVNTSPPIRQTPPKTVATISRKSAPAYGRVKINSTLDKSLDVSMPVMSKR
jgi:hypothetical protein